MKGIIAFKNNFTAFCILALFFLYSFVQSNPIINKYKISNLDNGENKVQIEFDEFTKNNIQQVNLYFENHQGGKQKIASLEKNIFGTYEADFVNSEPNIAGKYVLQIKENNGETSYYPYPQQEDNPISLSTQTKIDGELPLEILAPEPNSQVESDETTISASYLGLSEKVKVEATKIYIDENELKEKVEIFDDYLVAETKNLKPGKHFVRIQMFLQNGKFFGEKEFSFHVLEQSVQNNIKSFKNKKIRGHAFSNYRYQSLLGNKYSYNYFYSGARVSSNSEKVDWGLNLLYSNQDKKDRQPVNQYGANLTYKPFKNIHFRIKIGDMFPRYDNLFFMGLRNRGFEINTRLKFISLSYLSGVISRSIDEIRDTLNYVRRQGTYKREVVGIIPTLHFGQNSTTKFYYMHFKDDLKSIEALNPPQENTLFGIAQKVSLHQNRIILDVQAGVSLLNRDISSGNVNSDSLAQALKFGDKKYFDLAKKFITMNQYFTYSAPYAVKGNLSVNYLVNSFSVKYKYIEEGYTTFGNPYLYRDISGFTIYDRIQIISGRTYLTLQYEDLQSQMADKIKQPLKMKKMGFAINYYPANNYPAISIGYTNHSRNNKMESDSVFYGEDNSINQFYVNSNYKINLGNFLNSLNLNFSNYTKSDKVNKASDNNTQTISGGVKTELNENSFSRIFFTYNNSDIAKGDPLLQTTFKSTSMGLQFGYKMEKLITDDVLNLSLRYSYSKKDYDSYLRKQFIGRNILGLNVNFDLKQNGRINFNYQMCKYGKDVKYSDSFLLMGYEIRF